MKIPANVQTIIRSLWTKFPPRPSDNGRRAFMRMVGEQLAASIGPAWGYYKTEGTNGAPSKDLLPYVDPSGQQYGWDIISGATGTLQLGGEDVKLYDAVFHPLAPVDHLGAAPPAPPPTPPPSDDLAELQAQVAALTTRVAALEAPRFVALKGAHGLYLSAQPDGTVECNRAALASWEWFTMTPVKK